MMLLGRQLSLQAANVSQQRFAFIVLKSFQHTWNAASYLILMKKEFFPTEQVFQAIRRQSSPLHVNNFFNISFTCILKLTYMAVLKGREGMQYQKPCGQ